MYTIQQVLRQLRGWQGKTLMAVAEQVGVPVKHLAAIEQEGRRWKGDGIPDNAALLAKLAEGYGVVPAVLGRWLEDEWEWRVSARSGNPKTLPRMSQYIYRPLPEAAHNLFQAGFCVVDLETTGKDPHTGTQICEVTILDTDGVPLLNSLVNPGIHIPDELTANVHGISDEMVASAPTFREIGPEIARLIDGQAVVIYNAGYDAPLLDRLFIENHLDMPDFEQWCLMLAYAEHYKAPGSYGNYAWQKLSEACDQQDLEWDEEAHRSLADTTMTWKLLQKMAMQYGEATE
jgi:DNA polymerase III subunit epsilon